jgi:RNA polymerase sigma-70 factor (ECF subfamily)
MAEPTGPTQPAGADVVARAFQAESGRALATIARLVSDLGAAEDAVQEAFVAALRRWPVSGVPDNPGAWITTTARNRALDVVRREGGRPDRERSAARLALEATPPILHPVADDELRLLFTCCHPALAPEVRVTLALRLVCGLRVAEIARVLLQGEEAVAKRLQRAKAKVRSAAIPLRVPPPELLAERVPSVLECTYLLFTEGYAATGGDDLVRRDLCDEALRLARLIVALVPDDAGAQALLALVLLQDSRRQARFDADGGIVLLADQDRTRWDRAAIAEGEAWLGRALAHERVGAAAAAYLLQAAVAAEHARAATWEATDWPAIVAGYDQLVALTGSPAVELNRLVALSYADGPEAALPLLDALAAEPRLAGSHRLDAARADVRRRTGRHREAAELYRRALAAAGTEPERDVLRRRLAEVAPGG